MQSLDAIDGTPVLDIKPYMVPGSPPFDLSGVKCSHAQADHRLPSAVAGLTSLPAASASLTAIICFYALSRLDALQ